MIGYMSNYFPSLSETFIYREVMELRRRGIELRLYSIRRPDVDGLSVEARGLYDETVYLLPASIRLLFAAHFFFLFTSPLRYVKTLFSLTGGTYHRVRDRLRGLMHFGEGVLLARVMQRHGISHLHANFASQSTSVARVVSKLTGIPYSFFGHAHDIWHDRLQLPQKIEEAQFVCCCSALGKRWLAQQAGSDAGEKIHLVYHGIDVRRFAPPAQRNKKNENILLSVGRMTEQKGFSDLLSACAFLRDINCAVTVWLVGTGELQEELRRQARSLGIADRVVFWGAQPQEKILDFYHKATAFVLPCVDTRDGNRDGIPNVLLEAMACGLPVVTTDNAGQSELIEHGTSGVIVPSRAPRALAEALHELLIDPQLRARMAEFGRQRVVMHFDSTKTVLPLVELFAKVRVGPAERIRQTVLHNGIFERSF
jgi:glycosyltransferase involved in cell wall biosynthesis